MKILGFNFTKILVEKNSSNFKNIKITNKLDITEIKEAKADFLSNQEKILVIKFSYSVDFEEKAKIELSGNLLVSVNKELFEKILEGWKTKDIPQDFRIEILNLIFRKCNLKSFELENELNIPIHIKLPTLKQKEDVGENTSILTK